MWTAEATKVGCNGRNTQLDLERPVKFKNANLLLNPGASIRTGLHCPSRGKKSDQLVESLTLGLGARRIP
jgi:hypothetical protein